MPLAAQIRSAMPAHLRLLRCSFFHTAQLRFFDCRGPAGRFVLRGFAFSVLTRAHPGESEVLTVINRLLTGKFATFSQALPSGWASALMYALPSPSFSTFSASLSTDHTVLPSSCAASNSVRGEASRRRSIRFHSAADRHIFLSATVSPSLRAPIYRRCAYSCAYAARQLSIPAPRAARSVRVYYVNTLYSFLFTISTRKKCGVLAKTAL